MKRLRQLGELFASPVLVGSVVVNYVFTPARLVLVERLDHWYAS